MSKQRTNPVKAAGVLLMTETPLKKKAIPGQFLLMRHKDRWDLPKGHCDGNETYLETAHREMEEETGIKPSKCRFDPGFKWDIEYEVSYKRYPGQVFQKKIRYFLAWLPKVGKIEVTEHEGFEWMRWNPPHKIQPKTIDPLLAAVDDYIKTSV